jgi:hypothetical protein
MNIQPTHQFLTSAMLTGACRFRHVAHKQTSAWADEWSAQWRQLANAIDRLHKAGRKTALRKLVASVGRFLFDTFLRSPFRLLRVRLEGRTVGFMLAGLLPLFGAAILIAVPGLLFDRPEQRAYFFFADILRSDAASLLPVLLGVLSLVVALRFPLHCGGHTA